MLSDAGGDEWKQDASHGQQVSHGSLQNQPLQEISHRLNRQPAPSVNPPKVCHTHMHACLKL